MSEPRRNNHSTVLPNGSLLLDIAACSDIGSVRSENQDAWSVHPLGGGRDGALLVLADGMGGHADGAIASYLAVTASTDTLRDAPDPHRALCDAVHEANAAIAHRRAEHGGQVSGTTLVAAVVTEGRATIANVGDSRAYRLRDGRAEQVTADHSWVAEQVRAGLLDPHEAEGDHRRNLLTRALTGEPVQPDDFAVDLREGDVLVLCSDGAWDVLGGQGIATRFDPALPLQDEVERVVDDAINGGSTDNVTVLACRLVARGTAERTVPGAVLDARRPVDGSGAPDRSV